MHDDSGAGSGPGGSESNVSGGEERIEIECPVCGESIPVDAGKCPNCGESIEHIFFAEEEPEEQVEYEGVVYGEETRHPMPKRLRFDSKSLVLVILIGLVVVVGISLLVFIMLRGEKGISTPGEAVDRYYRALSEGDVDGMIQLFTSGFKPTPSRRKEMQEEFNERSYSVSELRYRTVSRSEVESGVVLEEVEVETSGVSGVASLSLSSDIVKPLKREDPDLEIVVNVVKYGGGWEIADRPLDGWSPETIWVLGQPSVP